MSKVVFLDYENDHDYKLVGIHTTLEDYRLAFSLNTILQTQLKRLSHDLDFNSDKKSYSLYTYDCEVTFTNWSLISNKYKFLAERKNQPLFNQQEQTSTLIKEKNKIDFFLKIDGDFNMKMLNETIYKINELRNIITSYSINPQTLKSKDFLIF